MAAVYGTPVNNIKDFFKAGLINASSAVTAEFFTKGKIDSNTAVVFVVSVFSGGISSPYQIKSQSIGLKGSSLKLHTVMPLRAEALSGFIGLNSKKLIDIGQNNYILVIDNNP